MAIFLIILSILLWLASLWAVMSKRQLLGPALSYLALLSLSFAKNGPFPIIPVNTAIIISWLCLTVFVMLLVLMQPPAMLAQTRGTPYMTVGGIVGMMVGLLSFTFTTSAPLIYALMIIATVLGVFFGFLLYTNTPRGAEVAIPTGRFFRYLLAKGFPVAITVMMIGVALVLIILVNSVPTL